MIPWLYLKGISTGAYAGALQAQFGKKQSWPELLLDLKQRGLSRPLKLAVGDGALGF